MQSRLYKLLTPNEFGANDNHQAGILISKANDCLDFFPYTRNKKINPFNAEEFLFNYSIRVSNVFILNKYSEVELK